tara:strand:+ start:853 stop:1107 length:255 start_codon:yes stop_codon:yes gene_type:complete
MATREIKIKASLEKEGVLKEIIDNYKQNEELKKVYTVLKSQAENPCICYAITSSEAMLLGIQRGSILSGILAVYKEYVLKENKE